MKEMSTVFGAVSSGIVVVCMVTLAILLTRQYVLRKSTYTLWWSVSFWLASIAAVTDLISYIMSDWTLFTYKLYLFAAATLVAYMGAGTVYLFSRRMGRVYVIIMSLIAVFMVVQLVILPIPLIHQMPSGEEAKNFLPKNPWIILSFAVLSGVGAIALFAGAVYSWIRSRLSYNLWIALGALIFSIGGSVGNVLGVYEMFYLFQAVGSVLLYYGIVRSYRRPKQSVKEENA
jgi:hypothetical protein